jgi:prevent-host-death family protein
MRTLSVNEVRKQLSEVLRDAEAGDSTVITRYGKPIAEITPIRRERPKFPDMSEFRASIKMRGKTLTDTLREMRDEERY